LRLLLTGRSPLPQGEGIFTAIDPDPLSPALSRWERGYPCQCFRCDQEIAIANKTMQKGTDHPAGKTKGPLSHRERDRERGYSRLCRGTKRQPWGRGG
jgi:hypothetical protein